MATFFESSRYKRKPTDLTNKRNTRKELEGIGTTSNNDVSDSANQPNSRANPESSVNGTPNTQDAYDVNQMEHDGAPSINEDPPVLRRSDRNRRPPEQLIDIMMTEIEENSSDIKGEIFCMSTMFPHDNQSEIEHPLLAFKSATSDPDTIYYHQVRGQEDWPQFERAMQQEMDGQMEDGNYSIIHRSLVPRDKSVLPAVWAMKRKRDIRTGEVKKWKARLNIDGSRMKHGVHYDETYAPVASWHSIRLILAMAAAYKWHTVQLDYVLAYTQAPVEREIYMECPKGFEIEGITENKDYVLKLNGTTYGQKQAGKCGLTICRMD